MRNIIIIIVVFFVFVGNNIFAQRYYHHQIEGMGGFGKTIPHRQGLDFLIKESNYSINLAYSIKTDGTKNWHHEWRFPELGVGFYTGGTGNFSKLGIAHSIYGFYGIPVYATERTTLKYRFGLGGAYLTEKFDSRANYYNVAIGSHFNAHIHFSVMGNFMLFEIPLYLTIGTSFNHFSNAAFVVPNLGINSLSIDAGLMYMLSEHSYSVPQRTRPFINRQYYFSMYTGIGSRQNTTYENINYIVNSLVTNIFVQNNYKRAFGIGTDMLFDTSLKTQMSDDSYSGTQDLFKVGLHIAQEVFLTNQLVCVIQAGSYVYNKTMESNFKMYNRLGIMYIFNDFFTTSFMIRSNGAVADFAELGLGYKIRL